jgi:hypothetical protein
MRIRFDRRGPVGLEDSHAPLHSNETLFERAAVDNHGLRGYSSEVLKLSKPKGAAPNYEIGFENGRDLANS